MASHRYNMHAGEWEETHAVVSGESLSLIAAHYRSKGWTDLTDWQPIYRLTRERTGLWRDQKKPNQAGNPNLIHPGDVLVIPRSRGGYLNVVQRVNELLRDSLTAPFYAAAVKKEADAYGERLDFESDVLTFLATASLSAAKAVKSAKLAKGVVGHAAKEFLKEKGLASAEMGLKITEYGAKSTGHEDVAKYSHAAAKAVHVADLAHGAKDFRDLAKNLSREKSYWMLVGESLGQVVDVIDVALDWTQPSKISKGLIRLFTGVDVDKTIDGAVEQEKRSREELIHKLQVKIFALQHEMQLVYPSKSR